MTPSNSESHISLPYLRAWRQKQLMTRVELAAAAGVSEATIAKLEAGKTAARISTIGKLATALQISRHQLVNENPELQLVGAA